LWGYLFGRNYATLRFDRNEGFGMPAIISQFMLCLAFTLKYEGGYVWNPHDPGGPTNCGITLLTLSHELGRKATVSEVRALTPKSPVVMTIYEKKYWNLIDGDVLPKGVNLMAFDICVNMGVGRILPWLEASKNMSPVDRIKYLHNKRMTFWKQLKIWVTFWKGWTRREQACYALALQMNAGA
jgi:lysozyme family protein